MSDPTVVCWRGPLSALAAHQKIPTKELARRVQLVALKRGGGFELRIVSNSAMATARRLLLRAEPE